MRIAERVRLIWSDIGLYECGHRDTARAGEGGDASQSRLRHRQGEPALEQLLAARFSELGYPEVRPSYGSVLLPLFEEDNLRMGEIAARARLSKQTMTTLVRLAERDGLVTQAAHSTDRRATRISLTKRASEFSAVAEMVVAGLEKRVEEALGAKRSADLRPPRADRVWRTTNQVRCLR